MKTQGGAACCFTFADRFWYAFYMEEPDMDALTCLLTRRSIRRFTDEPLDPTELATALKAAMFAPSAGDARPWSFILIEDRAMLDAVPTVHPHAAMTREAKAAVLICALPEVERYPGFWPIDCAAATQNLLLALHAQGLGGVWVGVWPDEARVKAFRTLFGIPETVIPHSFVPIGKPAAQPESKDRFDPTKIRRDRW